MEFEEGCSGHVAMKNLSDRELERRARIWFGPMTTKRIGNAVKRENAVGEHVNNHSPVIKKACFKSIMSRDVTWLTKKQRDIFCHVVELSADESEKLGEYWSLALGAVYANYAPGEHYDVPAYGELKEGTQRLPPHHVEERLSELGRLVAYIVCLVDKNEAEEVDFLDLTKLSQLRPDILVALVLYAKASGNRSSCRDCASSRILGCNSVDPGLDTGVVVLGLGKKVEALFFNRRPRVPLLSLSSLPLGNPDDPLTQPFCQPLRI